jgi:hypothetical protein
MNCTLKFVLAGLLTIGLVVLATSVWAQTTQSGSLGPTVNTRRSTSGSINMRDATFTCLTSPCDFSVNRVNPTGALPAGMAFRSGGFHVHSNTGAPILVQMCFAYTPQDAEKGSDIFLQTDGGWVSLGGVVSADSPKLICATISIEDGTFALVGSQ